jgi:hypothetical protein
MIGAVEGAVSYHIIKPVGILEMIHVPIDQFREAPRVTCIAR